MRCPFCEHEYPDECGYYGCPNCEGEGLEETGAVRDTYDPSRDGTRCVYGYWSKEQDGRQSLTKSSKDWAL